MRLFPSSISLPWKHPAEHRSILQGQRKANRPGKPPCWESRAQHWSHLLLWHRHPAHGGTHPRSQQNEDGCRETRSTLNTALPSLGHMGPWMPPPALQPGAGSSPIPAWPHSSPLTCSFTLWFMAHASMKNPKASPRSQESQGRAKAELPCSPSPMQGPLAGPCTPEFPPVPPCSPGAGTAPQTPLSSHNTAPGTKTQHQTQPVVFTESHPGPALLNTLGHHPGNRPGVSPSKGGWQSSRLLRVTSG